MITGTPYYKAFKLKARFYKMEISINTEQRPILNVDGDWEGKPSSNQKDAGN